MHVCKNHDYYHINDLQDHLRWSVATKQDLQPDVGDQSMDYKGEIRSINRYSETYISQDKIIPDSADIIVDWFLDSYKYMVGYHITDHKIYI